MAVSSILSSSQHFPQAVERVRIPWAEEDSCFKVDGLLSETECTQLIELSESYRGYESALVNAGGGQQVAMPQVRSSGRWMVDSQDAAALLWSRLTLIPEVVPEKTTNRVWRPVGLNSRLRFLRYTPGDYFAPHSDGSYLCNETRQRSLCTLMLYLNKPKSGGETNILSTAGGGKMVHDDAVSVHPTAGSGLIFDHDLYHEGALLKEGIKYAIRTDVMFERVRW